MRGKRGGPPSNVATMRAALLAQPGAASFLEGLELIRVFLKIRSEADRKRVLDLAKQLAPIDANART